jgi:hypothetical protein
MEQHRRSSERDGTRGFLLQSSSKVITWSSLVSNDFTYTKIKSYSGFQTQVFNFKVKTKTNIMHRG